jgi:microcompartment protein CcmL/EutN
MSNSIGLIESKGIVALVEATDVILKNSPVTILGIHKLDNGLVSLAVSGNSDYVKAAIESGVEAGRRVGEIYASSVVDNPGKELLQIFSELFRGNEISKHISDEINTEKVNFVDKPSDSTTSLFTTSIKQAKTESKREKSKPLQVTKITPIHKIKKLKEKTDHQNNFKIDESIEKNDKDVKKNLDEKDLYIESTKPLSTIERLRLEALGVENRKKKSKDITVPDKKINDKVKNQNVDFKNSDADFGLIDQMNVHKLRHYARKFPDFPIKGREISRANRDELVEWFKSIKNN